LQDKTRTYYFTAEDSTQVRVCKTIFCKTIQLASGTLNRTLKQEVQGTFNERRGQNEPANKSSTTTVNGVIRHINSFPHYISHYCRKASPDAKFLQQNLNLSLMYRMYVTDCTENITNPVSDSLYQKIFYKNFNLRFEQPKKDTCTKCDTFQTKIKCQTESKSFQHLSQLEICIKLVQKLHEVV